MDRNLLIKNIIIDSTYSFPKETVAKLLDACDVKTVKKKTILVEEGRICSDLFITGEGVTRISYFDGTKEVTFGFGGPGSIFLSPAGYLKRHPAYFSLVAVSDCEMLWIDKSRLDTLLKENPDLLMLLFHIAVAQFMSVELKIQENCKTAKERYVDLLNRQDVKIFASRDINHVDILGERISDKLIASYLGIIPTHLSNIKNEVMTEEMSKSKKKKE